MASPPVKDLAKQLSSRLSMGALPGQQQSPRASRATSSPMRDSPREGKAKEKERSVDEAVKKHALPRDVRGTEKPDEIHELIDIFEACRNKVSAKLNPPNSDKVVKAEKKVKLTTYLASLDEKLAELRAMDVQRRLMVEVDIALKKEEVEDILARINDTTSSKRIKELECLKADIARIITCDPTVDIPTCIFEMMRTAGCTALQECGQFIQNIPENYDDRLAKVDEQGLAVRFSRNLQLFQQYSGDKTPLPDTKGWTLQTCQAWAKCQKGFNELMTPMIRSCSQALFTGSLLKKDLFMHAKDPAFADTLNKLYASLPAGAQQIYRCFDKDGNYSIMLVLPIVMKTQGKETGARFTIEYDIQFDKRMNVVSLTSKASRPIYGS